MTPVTLNSPFLKEKRLREILGATGSALVAYSGGIDSAYLLKVAAEVMGDRVVALTALSPSFPSYERKGAFRFVREIGIRHLVVETDELQEPRYRANRGDRCYFCKSTLFEVCRRKAERLGFKEVFDGTQCDDLGDDRPGRRAAAELGVRSPLVEAGFHKAEIRESARVLGLKLWDKPAMACLASRLPVGIEVTEQRLVRIDRVEAGLARLGFRTFRVRFHEPVARIEVGPEEIGRFSDSSIRDQVARLCRENGFADAALDLDGYRCGGAGASPQRIQRLTL